MAAVADRPIKKRGRPKIADDHAKPKAELLLEAGVAAFAASGFDGASLRQIAGLAGVDSALIKHHFGSKLGLWQAAIDNISSRVTAGIAEASGRRAEDGTPAARLADILSDVVDLVCDIPHLTAFILREIAEQGTRFSYMYERLIRPLRDLLVPHVEAANRAGELPGLDPDFLYVASFGSIVTTVMARNYLVHTAPESGDEDHFRKELKRIVRVMVARATPLGEGEEEFVRIVGVS